MRIIGAITVLCLITLLTVPVSELSAQQDAIEWRQAQTAASLDEEARLVRAVLKAKLRSTRACSIKDREFWSGEMTFYGAMDASIAGELGTLSCNGELTIRPGYKPQDFVLVLMLVIDDMQKGQEEERENHRRSVAKWGSFLGEVQQYLDDIKRILDGGAGSHASTQHRLEK